MGAMPTIRALNNLTRFRECDELVTRTSAARARRCTTRRCARTRPGSRRRSSVHRGDAGDAHATRLTELGEPRRETVRPRRRRRPRARHRPDAAAERRGRRGDRAARSRRSRVDHRRRPALRARAARSRWRSTPPAGPTTRSRSARSCRRSAAARISTGCSPASPPASRSCSRARPSDAAAAFEEAQTAAFATDSRLDRAIVIVARACAYAALDLPSGHELATEANLTLHGAGFDAHGWRTGVRARRRNPPRRKSARSPVNRPTRRSP